MHQSETFYSSENAEGGNGLGELSIDAHEHMSSYEARHDATMLYASCASDDVLCMRTLFLDRTWPDAV